MCAQSNPHLSFAAGFGTLLSQVAGFHRAVPSTTLDKACMQLLVYSSGFLENVKTFLIIPRNCS